MSHQVKSARRLAVGTLLALTTVWIGCGSNGNGGGGFFTDGGGADGNGSGNGNGGRDGSGGGPGVDSGMVHKLGGIDSSTPACVKPTCTELSANCGTVTDKKCGGVVECGTCGTGESCGGGGTPNKCGNMVVSGEGGTPGDGCAAKLTCAGQSISCGVASDGCGGMLSCGTCNIPQTCGGDPTKPGACGCTGECSAVVACSGTKTTDLIGTVYDPAGVNPLYNVLVYVPNDPTDPGLKPFPPGISCDICGSEAAGDPLVTTFTAADGTFTLSGVPVGMEIPVVIQLGRWRRQFTLPITNACGANSVPAGTKLSMPQNHSQGDLPRIAVVTGSYDPVECALVDIGIDASEFTDPGGGGYINFFTANDADAPPVPYYVPEIEDPGAGSVISSSTPTQDALFATTGAGDGGVLPLIDNYDMVIIECEGYPQAQTQAQEAALAAYLAAGGRVFGSDYIYDWMYDNPALQGAADWAGNHCGDGFEVNGTIDLPPTNPTGTAFDEWLEVVGVSGTGSDVVQILPAFANVPSVILPTQQWIHTTDPEFSAQESEFCNANVDVPSPLPVQFTFNTPLGASAAKQCGRVTFNDWHAFVNGDNNVNSFGTTFPAECEQPGAGSSPQEKILEFMIFDLSACVQPYTPVCTPRMCATAGVGGTAVECGPAGDGCGGVLQCGSCTGGQVCGGGGASKCGTATTTMCMAETCASQGIQCGPAGDGCGNELQCGNCPTGEICGFSTPGVCGGSVGPAFRLGTH